MSDPNWKRVPNLVEVVDDYDNPVVTSSFVNDIGNTLTILASLEQAIIRSHPDVIRLVDVARRVWEFNREKGSPLGDYDMIEDLDAALAPFEEKAE